MTRLWSERRTSGYVSPNKGRMVPSMRGENHPRYVNGKWRTVGRVEYKAWRQQVFERDNHTCVNCGSKENLQTDHILPYSIFPEKRLDVTNGRTLCRSCHEKIGWSILKYKNPGKGHKKGVGISQEHREKIRKTLTGFKHSPEARANMAAAHRKAWAEGRKRNPTSLTEEHRKHISEGLQRAKTKGRPHKAA